MRSLIDPSTGSKATSFVMPAAMMRPAFCRTAARYQREFCPLQPRTWRAPSTATDQIHVGVPNVTPSSRNGEMCKSSASAILRSSSFDHVIGDSASLLLFLLSWTSALAWGEFQIHKLTCRIVRRSPSPTNRQLCHRDVPGSQCASWPWWDLRRANASHPARTRSHRLDGPPRADRLRAVPDRNRLWRLGSARLDGCAMRYACQVRM